VRAPLGENALATDHRRIHHGTRTMSIRDWPEDERPREKLLARGAHALTSAELVAILLGNGVRGRSALDMGRDLLTSAGSLNALLSKDVDDVPGLGPAKRARLVAGLELARRCLGEELSARTALSSPRDSAAFLKAQLAHKPYEVFACLFLDNRHRVLAFEELFRGTLDGASVHPREVVRAALKHNAAAVILAHNHPSGVAEPSAADRNITRQLRDALQLVGVRVLDHLVVGAGEPTSMAARGLI
jgi:DNA repair protein RadC